MQHTPYSDVKLPAALVRQAELADQLEQALKEQAEAEQARIRALQNPPPPPPPATPVPAIEPNGTTQISDGVTQTQDDPNSETWQHKYKSMYGRYSAEVPRLQAQLRETNAKLQELTQRLSQQEAQKVNDKEREAASDLYGKDLTDYINETAERIARDKYEELKQNFQQVDTALAKTEKQNFLSEVSAQVPNWKEVDKDPQWVAWLQEEDAVWGQPRQVALEHAASTHDVQRVVQLFKTFLTLHPPQTAAAPSAPNSLDQHLTPRTVGAVAAEVDGGKRIYTQQEVSKLLDWRYLKSLPQEQASAIERDIDLAFQENRIAP